MLAHIHTMMLSLKEGKRVRRFKKKKVYEKNGKRHRKIQTSRSVIYKKEREREKRKKKGLEICKYPNKGKGG